MFASRVLLILVVAGLCVSGCGRWGKRAGVKGAIPVDEGVVASATAEWYPDGSRTPFARRSTGILIVTAQQLRFMTYDDQNEEYAAVLSLSRSGLYCGQRTGTASKGELWCQNGEQSHLFVSKEAGDIAAAFVNP
jgi:hypothetical protein